LLLIGRTLRALSRVRGDFIEAISVLGKFVSRMPITTIEVEVDGDGMFCYLQGSRFWLPSTHKSRTTNQNPQWTRNVNHQLGNEGTKHLYQKQMIRQVSNKYLIAHATCLLTPYFMPLKKFQIPALIHLRPNHPSALSSLPLKDPSSKRLPNMAASNI